ncbi:hypothetical protein QMK61_16400 [Fulvimonas sp. R45]|jgi:hypothetical protein|uniref:hypothetical protein n=1 Tax=Fulvimonas sp. R45 TaxID=3045937 RepID=UPI00265E9A68|nr:hypothetical protein [Fulvimonas sp. R45]MDO1530420.1 hypothetical protein [Fulvimonas sp. R45]
MNNQQREAILKHCAPDWRNQYQPVMLTRRGWAKLDPGVIVDLLDSASHAAYHRARELLVQMRQQTWSARATVHAGGTGDAQRGADPNPHITLRVGKASYHLRCKERPQLHIVDITA